jgi:hypothetical protein
MLAKPVEQLPLATALPGGCFVRAEVGNGAHRDVHDRGSASACPRHHRLLRSVDAFGSGLSAGSRMVTRCRSGLLTD